MMRRAAFPFLLAPLLAVHVVAHAATIAQGTTAQDMFAAIRAERWHDADSLAATLPDPLAGKLVLYFRVLAPGGAHGPEIAAFIAENPSWPQQALLARRLDEALAADGDDTALLDRCQRPPAPSHLLLRCAEAAGRAGHADEPEQYARAAWVSGVAPAGELAFIHAWGRVLTADDQWRRFDRLAWTDSGLPGSPAARQAVRVHAVDRPASEAWLALRRDDASGSGSKMTAVPPRRWIASASMVPSWPPPRIPTLTSPLSA